MNGKFIISLDFELHWGIFDHSTVSDYEENLKKTKEAIHKILELSDISGVRLTFATVGFLFSKDKTELERFSPKAKPNYTNKLYNPYKLIDEIGNNEIDSPYHYAYSTIKELFANKNHEIGTHTFCHYYCFAEGQTLNQFNADIESAVAIAKPLGIAIKSIVFPRNQVNYKYLEVCKNNGITSYRGTENAWVYKPKRLRVLARLLRLIDSYINIFGYHTYTIDKLKEKCEHCLNLPSSRFLRPYKKKLFFLEPLKIRRIKNAMTYAAKNNQLYHLWWHPHNFGANLEKNLDDLKSIYKHYEMLNKKYGFESETMTSLTNKIL